MLIRFISPTNIRVSAYEHAIPPIGIIHSGVEVEVENRLYHGAEIDGIDTYFKDRNGWYYWTGRTVMLYKALPSPAQSTLPSTTTLPYEAIGNEQQLEPFTDTALESSDPGSANGKPSSEIPEISSSAMLAHTDQQPGSSSYHEHLKNWAILRLGIDTCHWEAHNLSGRNVRTMLIGTGIDPGHPDFSGRVAACMNFCSPSQEVSDADGAGTACAGILAGSGKENWLGVAPGTTLYIGKIMNNPLDFDYRRLKSALDWCLKIRPELLLFCLDFRGDSITEAQRAELTVLLDTISRMGTLCIAPAGDGGVGSRPETRWPASLDVCLSVGAFGRNDLRLATSLRSYALDVLAPGEDLVTPSFSPRVASSSQAAAFAAGVAALSMEYAAKNHLSINTDIWRRMIRNTAIAKHERTKCHDLEYGCGRIQPAALLDALMKMKNEVP